MSQVQPRVEENLYSAGKSSDAPVTDTDFGMTREEQFPSNNRHGYPSMSIAVPLNSWGIPFLLDVHSPRTVVSIVFHRRDCPGWATIWGDGIEVTLGGK